jgi:hypothetical protein
VNGHIEFLLREAVREKRRGGVARRGGDAARGPDPGSGATESDPGAARPGPR